MGSEPLRRAAPGAGRPGPPEIPGYRIEAVLGRGSTGVVYRAVQLSIQRRVALKVLHAGAASSERTVRRLEREARTAALLAHPSIISAIDMGRTGEAYWFAMELVEGQSLAERLEHGGRLSEREALRLFVPLADALQHACEKGVVHRDVKPANILLEPGGRPRLVDLGLARIDDDPALTRTGGTLGTPFYISPEQARDPGGTDIRGDIWSLGATLYHAVCGRPPFGGRGAAEILSNVLYEPVPDPRHLRPELSRGLALVIRKCLSRDPDRRYFVPAELREDLERIREHKAPAVRESQLEPSAESGRRARRFWTAGAVLGLALLIGALALLGPWPRGGEGSAATPAESGSFAPLEGLAEDLARGGRDLAAAYHELRELEPLLPAARRPQWAELYGAVHAALRDELARLRREHDPLLERALAERRFAGFDELLERDWPLALGARTGFSLETLPAALRGGLEQWRGHWRVRRDQAHGAALAAVAASVERFLEDVLAKRVVHLAAQGRWQEARALLEGGVWAHLEEAGAQPGDLSRGELAPVLAAARTRLEGLVVRLEEDWRALDQDLARRARDLAREARERLRSRQAVRVVEGYDAALRAELARRGLDLETWPGPPLRSETPAVGRAEREALVELEQELLAQDARALFAEREAQAAGWMRERRFAEARRFWSEGESEPILELLRERVALRIEEARVLESFLESVGEGLRVLAQGGERIALPVGTIRAEGRVDAGPRPLEEGFRFLYDSGGEAAQQLRLTGPPDTPAGGLRLGPAALERLAERAPLLERDADYHLGRALLRYHEGDLVGARAVLAEPGLSADDALVHELALRIEAVLGEEGALRARRRAYVERRLSELEGFLAHGTARRGRELVQELLTDYAELLSAEELRALRTRRRELVGTSERPGAEEFRSAFGADRVELVGSDRVRLAWGFDAAGTGAWRVGPWRFDGQGWAAPGPAHDVALMVRRGGPTLRLEDPLLVSRGASELRLELEQLWPPRLVVVSLCGFHVALAAAAQGGARLVVGTSSLEDCALRAGAGQGQAIEGLREGATHVLTVRANPTRGTLEVLLDGRVLTSQALPSPRGDPRRSSAAVHSLEPVRLLAAELETAR